MDSGDVTRFNVFMLFFGLDDDWAAEALVAGPGGKQENDSHSTDRNWICIPTAGYSTNSG